MLSILIPTLNRPAFLERTLGYLRAQGFAGQIIVGDGSFDDTSALCRRFAAERLDCRRLNQQQTFGAMADALRTPYAVYCGDDDFLIPSGLAACVKALERTRDYRVARGHGLVINANGAHGIPFQLEPYQQQRVNGIPPLGTFVDALTDYRPALFSVHHTFVWQEMFRCSRAMKDKWMGAEIAPSLVSASFSRTLVLDIPYLARQIHQERYGEPMGEPWFTSQDVQDDSIALLDQLRFQGEPRRIAWNALHRYMVGYQQSPASVRARFWKAEKIMGEAWFRAIHEAMMPEGLAQ